MIENIKRMRARHDREIAQLQRLCKHVKHHRSIYAWAPGHFGSDVEVCDYCGKILKIHNDGNSIRYDSIKSKPLNKKEIKAALEAFRSESDE